MPSVRLAAGLAGRRAQSHREELAIALVREAIGNVTMSQNGAQERSALDLISAEAQGEELVHCIDERVVISALVGLSTPQASDADRA